MAQQGMHFTHLPKATTGVQIYNYQITSSLEKITKMLTMELPYPALNLVHQPSACFVFELWLKSSIFTIDMFFVYHLKEFSPTKRFFM